MRPIIFVLFVRVISRHPQTDSGIVLGILRILSFARQTYHNNREKELFDMKATGIVRRIDDYVIIGGKVGKP